MKIINKMLWHHILNLTYHWAPTPIFGMYFTQYKMLTHWKGFVANCFYNRKMTLEMWCCLLLCLINQIMWLSYSITMYLRFTSMLVLQTLICTITTAQTNQVLALLDSGTSGAKISWKWDLSFGTINHIHLQYCSNLFKSSGSCPLKLASVNIN
jgi:hypothetical protein